MERLSLYNYRNLHPGCLGLWAGHLGVSSPATRHWVLVRRSQNRDGSTPPSRQTANFSFQAWWESGLERKLIFSGKLLIKSEAFPPDSEAVWAAHRLVQLFALCAEPELLLYHDVEIQEFWLGLIKEILESSSRKNWVRADS